ncbi:hypothetical protein [Microvirga sp. Mcv34]|uniref:hypothetical protein n=1 Tax=Microvirga sp. Mcv34 TaxID=2926016 RepID=UPI0021CACDBD|nr:hypothetical protein [Microvirga sp. Mcv34]
MADIAILQQRGFHNLAAAIMGGAFIPEHIRDLIPSDNDAPEAWEALRLAVNDSAAEAIAFELIEGAVHNEQCSGPGTYAGWANATDIVDCYLQGSHYEDVVDSNDALKDAVVRHVGEWLQGVLESEDGE